MPQAAAITHDRSEPRRRLLTLAILAAMGGTLIVAWSPTLVRMWGRWFPAWDASGAGGMGRFTSGSSYYTHAPLVPLASLILALGIYRRKGFPIDRSRRDALIGWGVFISSCLLHLLSIYARVMFVSGFALVLTLAALLLICGGRGALRRYAAPLALLLFMVPLPMHWIAGLNFAGKTFAGHAAVWATNTVCGVAAMMDGSYVYLAGKAGVTRVVVIDDVCSGLRSLIALLWFASLYAACGRSSGRRRWVLVLAAAPVAVGCNILRITVLNVGAVGLSVASVGEGGWVHDTTGFAMFAVAIAIQYGLDRMLAVAQTSPHKPPCLESRRQGTGEHRVLAPSRFVPAATVLLVVAALSLLGSRSAVAAFSGHIAHNAIPATLSIGGRTFLGADHTLGPRTLAILETDDYLYRTYAADPTDRTVSVLIIYSGDNRKGAHPPEVCLTGSGHRIVSRALRLVGPDAIPMQELVTDGNGRRMVHLYVYRFEDRYTTSYARQQAMILVNGILRRPAGAAVVRITAPVVGRDEHSARDLALTVAEQILPEITATMP